MILNFISWFFLTYNFFKDSFILFCNEANYVGATWVMRIELLYFSKAEKYLKIVIQFSMIMLRLLHL